MGWNKNRRGRRRKQSWQEQFEGRKAKHPFELGYGIVSHSLPPDWVDEFEFVECLVQELSRGNCIYFDFRGDRTKPHEGAVGLLCGETKYRQHFDDISELNGCLRSLRTWKWRTHCWIARKEELTPYEARMRWEANQAQY